MNSLVYLLSARYSMKSPLIIPRGGRHYILARNSHKVTELLSGWNPHRYIHYLTLSKSSKTYVFPLANADRNEGCVGGFVESGPVRRTL